MTTEHGGIVDPDFRWPERFAPASARLYIRNTRTIRAPRENIWNWLVAAPRWNSWFPNATNVSVPDGKSTLDSGMRFRWSQSGVALDTTVTEFVPGARLAWFARSPFVTAYHAWDIQPHEDGFLVITDETQRGPMPAVLGPLLKPRMLAVHDLWLKNLERQAADAAAPPA